MGVGSVEHALREGYPEVARWVYEHASRGELDHGDDAIEAVIREALDIGAIEFAESVVPEGTNVLDYAMDCKRVEVIERLVEGGYFEQGHFSAAGSIAKLARADRLDLIERISTQQNLPPDHSDFWGMDWIQALSTACQSGNMVLLQWLVEHPMGDDLIEGEISVGGGLKGLLCRAAEGGHTHVMEYLNNEGIVAEHRTALLFAIRAGQLNSVNWLVEHFPLSEKIPDYCVMDEAAKFDQIEILQHLDNMDMFVPGWDPIPTSKRKKKAQGDSEFRPAMMVTATGRYFKVHKGAYQHQTVWRPTDPMAHAAANGHLNVVQWIHSNRPEGCSTDALGYAAANGHLEIMQWLKSKRPEGCTTKAMDGAAANGHLDMVKWLHENTEAGCTSAAMEQAARNGQLQTLQWLHTYRSEGCTAKALEGAIGNGHLHGALWLQLRYPEYVPSKLNVNLFVANKFEIFLFVHAHYAHLFTQAFVQNILVDGMRHNPNENNNEIIAWLHEHYPEESAIQVE